MQRDDECSWQRACKIEEDICSSVFWNITLLNNSLALELSMCEFVRSQDLMLLLLPLLAFCLASHIVKVGFVGL